MRYAALAVALGIVASGCQPDPQAQHGISRSKAARLPPELLAQLEDFQKARQHTSLDLPTLRQIKDEQLDRVILDYIFDRIDRSPGARRDVVLSLPSAFRTVYLSWLVEAEVLNGGFNQYFWNSSSDFADLTPAALTEIGSPEAARIMRQAIATANAEWPITSRFREEGTVEAFIESYQHTRLNDYDDPFATLAEQFSALRLRYIRANEQAFVTEATRG